MTFDKVKYDDIRVGDILLYKQGGVSLMSIIIDVNDYGIVEFIIQQPGYYHEISFIEVEDAPWVERFHEILTSN